MSTDAPRPDVRGDLLHVAEQEMHRVLLDIHDGPVQNMYAALSQLDLLQQALSRAATPGSDMAFRAERIRVLLESGLREIRSYLSTQLPPEFAARELPQLLEGLAAQHESNTDTPVALTTPSHVPGVPVTVKVALYRIAQEALSNAYRHGGARRATLTLAFSERDGGRVLRLEVSDDGSGFDVDATRPVGASFGIAGMRARAAMVGGTCAIASERGAGTRVIVEVPLS